MIRKQTWILLITFAVLTGFAFYLQKNPLSLQVDVTPSPTTQSSMINDWSIDNLIGISYQDDERDAFILEKDDSNNWIYQPDGQMVGVEKISQLLAEITNAKAISNLDSGYDLTALGLHSPTKIITLIDKNEALLKIQVGQMTPTMNGYYVQVGLNAPIVVSRGAIELILDLLKKETLLDFTPTPIAPTNVE